MKFDKTLYKLRSYSMLSVLILSLVAPVAHANGLDEGYARRRVEVGCEIDYGEDGTGTTDESGSWQLVLVNRDNKKLDSDFNITLGDVAGVQVDSRIKGEVAGFLAKAQEVNGAIRLISGFRSYDTQKVIYNGYVESEMTSRGVSRAEAEKFTQVYSQPEGASEHMTGLAIDITYASDLNQMDGATIKKLEEIGQEYGFIRRFKEKYKSSTGIGEEDWHFRYVGKEHAKAINQQDISLEDYLKDMKAKAKQAPNKTSQKTGKKTSSSPASGSAFAGLGDAGGPWTQPGTKQYQIAQIAFRILTEEYGLSGYSASGWLGNIQSESGFDPNIIEAENGQDYKGRGFGLFQFTPAEKFTGSKFYNPKANLEDSVRAQIAFVWESEFKNQYAFTAAKGYVTETYSIIGSKWFDYNNIKPEHFLDSESPEKAMYYFFAGYERGNYHLMHETRRKTAAQVADKLFNQKKVKADPSKWKFGEGVNSSYTPKVTMASAYEGGEDCEDTTEKTSSAPTELLEKWEEVLDFKPKGDGIGSGIDMDFQFGSQCFDLIRYYLSKMITDKDGNHFEVNLAGAEGANQIGSVAGGWSGGWEVRQMGNLDPQDLKPGDVIFGNLPTESTYGHTVVILSEVSDTGDFLYIDQNTPRPSINKGNLNTWVKGQVGYVRPPAGWKMAKNVIVEEYINDNVPTYPGGWRGGHGVSWAKATPEDIQQLAGN